MCTVYVAPGIEINARMYWHNQVDIARMEQLQPVLGDAVKQPKAEGILAQDGSLTREICDGVTREEFIYAYAGMLLDPNFGSVYDGASPVEVNVYHYYT